MIKIQLANPKTGKKETFTQDYIKARYVRDGLKLKTIMLDEETSDLDTFEKAIDFVVAVMNNSKVTEDTILDGVSHEEIWQLLGTVLDQVLSGSGGEEDGEEGKQ